MTPTAVNLVEHEGQMIASPPAIVSPPASGPLAVKEDACDITVEEEAVDEHEIDEESPDDDSDKGPTFVRSSGAWSKPLHFTPSPTPPEPATPSLLCFWGYALCFCCFHWALLGLLCWLSVWQR
ncbi:unnamed protein product [Brassica oleracea var. botrytis]